jgi:hypothetical protein
MFILNALSINVYTKPWILYRTAQLDLEVGTPALHVGGPYWLL